MERGIKGVRLRPRGLKPEGLTNNLNLKRKQQKDIIFYRRPSAP